MASKALLARTLKSIRNPSTAGIFSNRFRHFSSTSTAIESESSTFTFDSNDDRVTEEEESRIQLKGPDANGARSVTMPMSFMTGSVVGKRFYKKVSTREAEDGNGWSVMLDYRTLKTPAKRALKLPNLFLAKAIAAEWEYQV